MLTVVAIWAVLIFGAAKLGEMKRTRELGRSLMAGLLGLGVTFTRRKR